MATAKVLPFEKQDRLEDGLLKVNYKNKEDVYADIFLCNKYIGTDLKSFADISEQDRLKEGSIKIEGNGYLPINDLNEINIITDLEDYPQSSDDLHFFGIGDCFVATAVYGNENAPQIQKLREFRDTVLMQNKFGRAFTGFYYSGAGKKAAQFIKEHLPSAIPAIRKGLDVLVNYYSETNKSKMG